jgi:hypothetical protein
MAAITALAIGAGSAAIAAGGSLVAANQAKQQAKGAKNAADRKAAEILAKEQSRQSIPNPYENVRDLSHLTTDLSGGMSNPYASLGVATQAAKMQAEEADLSLANTLDTLRATGGSAGGATALAQAALQSKKGVSANIEQQESTVEKMKAQGEADLKQQKTAEAQRLQTAKLSEAQRMQSVGVEATKFQYGEQEGRDVTQLNRLAGQQAQHLQDQANYNASKAALYGSAISAVGSMGSAAISAGGSMGAAKIAKG